MLRCPGTLTLGHERWSDYSEGDACLSILCLWPNVAFISEIVWACFGRFYCLSGLAVGGFESLTALRGYIYDGCFKNFSLRMFLNCREKGI